MDLERTAACMAALGNVARLRIFRLLVRAGRPGMTITALREMIDMPASTLAHHLRTMTDAGLVLQERVGREVYCRAEFALVKGAWAHFQAECCRGFADLGDGNAACATTPAAAETDRPK